VKKASMAPDRKRIVIFNVNWLGDVLFSTAVIRNIRSNYPASYIACIIPKRCVPVLEGNPYINEIIIFDEKSSHKGVLGKLAFIRELNKKRFDCAFLLHRSMTRAFIIWAAGIRERIGYVTAKRGIFLTKKVQPPDINRVHRIDYYLGVIAGAGLAIKDRHTNFFYSGADREFVQRFLQDRSINPGDIIVGLNPGGNWGLKRWQKENFAALADRLIDEMGARVIFTGSPEDKDLVSEIKSFMRSPADSACGILSLKQFAALCGRMSVFVTADSGPLHIANAAGAKKIIALFGPTHPELTGPVPAERSVILQKNTGCNIPCYTVNCSDNRCMKAISVEDVFAATRSAIRAASK
jgi:heptosyltransferase-2